MNIDLYMKYDTEKKNNFTTCDNFYKYEHDIYEHNKEITLFRNIQIEERMNIEYECILSCRISIAFFSN